MPEEEPDQHLCARGWDTGQNTEVRLREIVANAKGNAESSASDDSIQQRVRKETSGPIQQTSTSAVPHTQHLHADYGCQSVEASEEHTRSDHAVHQTHQSSLVIPAEPRSDHGGQQQTEPQNVPTDDVGSDEPVREEDINVQICEDMSRGRPVVMSPISPKQPGDGREIIEYHGGINSITILGEALGQQRHNRLVKVVVLDDRPELKANQVLSGLDAADMEYLSKKGALSFPPRGHCDEMLRMYFSTVYPYAPILDRIRFTEEYNENRHSLFLMQCILANVVPHASKDLLRACGYESRLVAQKSLFSKARLLYDLGCEKSQLHRLQGSIMLSSLSFSYAMDKDYRYWLSNAARIAIQMGLNRNSVSASLDPGSRKLLRRIWWVLYNRDTLLAISGIDNLRRFDDRHCDTEVVTEEDLDETDNIPDKLRHTLTPITRLQKLFMVEYSKLSIISNYFIQAFKMPGVIPAQDDIEKLSDQIARWRQELPTDLQPQVFQEWSKENIWTLVLLALAFRLEAVFCRCAREYYRAHKNESACHRSAQRQERAMFELSKIIQTASMHDLVHLCPLSFMTCASTNLAMRIEIALRESTPSRRKLTARTQIFSDLEYLRESCEYWNSLIWTVRMVEAVLERTQLGLPAGMRSHDRRDKSHLNSENANHSSSMDWTERDEVMGNMEQSDDRPAGSHIPQSRSTADPPLVTVANASSPHNSGPEMLAPASAASKVHRTGGGYHDTLDALGTDPIMGSLPILGEDIFGILPVMDAYDWMQDSFSDFGGDFDNVGGVP